MTTALVQTSKLEFSGGRTVVPTKEANALVAAILEKSGCAAATALVVGRHLVDADLCGVESHGVMRILQYAEQFESGYLKADASPVLATTADGLAEIDGRGGIGMPAMMLAVKEICTRAKSAGIAALPVRNVGHTGRLGAYAETAAEAGCLLIIIGGGGRHNWRQVAPFGGRKALLPTNPTAWASRGATMARW